MNEKVIVVFGGCFNPPTNAHFWLAEQLLDEHKEIDKVLFVPVGDEYEKAGLISAKHRVNMLNQVCMLNDRFDVSTIEVDAARQLKTIETLLLLKTEYPTHDLWFCVGTDNLKQIKTWERYKELLENYKVLVLLRDNDCPNDIIDTDDVLKNYQDSFITSKEVVISNISASLIRERVRNNMSIRYLVQRETEEYILKNNLYRKERDKDA